MKCLKILFIFFVLAAIAACSVNDDIRTAEDFPDSGHTEAVIESDGIVTDDIQSFSGLSTDTQSEAGEITAAAEEEDPLQKCIKDVRERNPLEIIEISFYDIDGDGEDEILILAEGAFMYNSRTLYVYKVTGNDIQSCGEVDCLLGEIYDDIFEPGAGLGYKMYDKVIFSRLSYNGIEYDCVIGYYTRTYCTRYNHISQLTLSENGTVSVVPLVMWGVDTEEKYYGPKYNEYIYCYFDGDEKEISREELEDILGLIE